MFLGLNQTAESPQLYYRTTLDGTAVEQRILSIKPAYREVVANVSAYTLYEGGQIGAWGDTLKTGDCAADDLAYGAQVYLPDGRVLIVRDKFGGNYRNRIDIYYGEDLSGAIDFGRQQLKIRVEE